MVFLSNLNRLPWSCKNPDPDEHGRLFYLGLITKGLGCGQFSDLLDHFFKMVIMIRDGTIRFLDFLYLVHGWIYSWYFTQACQWSHIRFIKLI